MRAPSAASMLTLLAALIMTAVVCTLIGIAMVVPVCCGTSRR